MFEFPHKAYRNPGFLNSAAARPLRILSEYLEPNSRLAHSCLYGCFSKPQDVGVEVIASCPGHARGGCGRKA